MTHGWRLALALVLEISSTRVGVADPLASAFGAAPALWGVRMSPDGSKLSYLRMHPNGLPIAVVLDTRTGKANIVLASVENEFDIQWCDWANAERLLCGFYGIHRHGPVHLPATRLVAVGADGSDMKVLLQWKLRDDRWTLFQDRIVDWLVEDPREVLIAMPTARGSGVSRLDVYSGETRLLIRALGGVWDWLSDNRGTPRLRFNVNEKTHKWSYRRAGETKWRLLHEWEPILQRLVYEPVGFGRDPNRLFVLKPHEGRVALWAEDLGEERKAELVFAHPDVDVGEPLFLGKFRRMVAVSYSTDKPRLHYFDPDVAKIVDAISASHPNRAISVVDESWDRRYYALHIGSDLEPGAYYWLDVEKGRLALVARQYPELRGHRLASMQPIRYAARDGTEIPAYLTLPPSASQGPAPAVILPHGGPTSRDHWGFDWLPQFLAAKGYIVLQSNYRGSSGYGEDWIGKGAFRGWRLAIDDLADGAKHLVESGLADSARICIVGWSYGGYAALQSSVVEPERYRCAVGVAPVTDPGLLIENMRLYFDTHMWREFVGTGDDVLEDGSPLRRADEIRAPILLFHGDEDINVPVDHSRKMAQALKHAEAPVEYVEYEEADHQIARNAYRIDMLTRIGAFLDQYIGASAQTESPGASAPPAGGAAGGLEE